MVKVVPAFSGKRDVKDVFSQIIINKISDKTDLDMEKNTTPAYNSGKQ